MRPTLRPVSETKKPKKTKKETRRTGNSSTSTHVVGQKFNFACSRSPGIVLSFKFPENQLRGFGGHGAENRHSPFIALAGRLCNR